MPTPLDLPRGTSMTAAVSLALMAVLAGTAHALVLGPLIAGEPVAPAPGVVAFSIVAILDVVVAVALWDALAPAGRWLSGLAAAFRLVYTAVLGVGIGMLALGGLAGAPQFDALWGFGLSLFGAHLVLVGVLVLRAGGSGRVIGPLVSIAGVGYAVDSYAGMLAPEAGIQAAQFTFVGEVVLIVWLLVRALRTRRAASA